MAAIRSQLISLSLFVSVLFLAAPSAEASRARALVLGTGDAGAILGSIGSSGSFTHNDIYNVFYNPSYAANNRDWAIIEKYDGRGAVGGGTNGAAGGFMTSFATFTFGFYFNREGAVDPAHYNGATGGAANYRPLDLILAADLGMKFGLGLSYGSNEQAGGEGDDLTLRLGAQVADFDPFVHYQVAGSTSAGAATDLVVLGLRYHWGEWNPVVAYRQHRLSGSTDSRRFGLGISRFAEGTEGVRYGFSISYWRDSSTSTTTVPFELLIQGKVASWLVLRAGLYFPAVSRTGGISNVDSTTGRVGATLMFGALEMDWAIGSGSTSNSTFAPQTTTAPLDNPTFGLDDSLFTAASLTYRW